MPHAHVDLHIPGIEAFADYEGADLVLYVVHDRTSAESVHDLRKLLNPHLAPGGKFFTYRLKPKGDPDANWS